MIGLRGPRLTAVAKFTPIDSKMCGVHFLRVL